MKAVKEAMKCLMYQRMKKKLGLGIMNYMIMKKVAKSFVEKCYGENDYEWLYKILQKVCLKKASLQKFLRFIKKSH